MGFQGPGPDGEEGSDIGGMDLPINLGVNIKQSLRGNLEEMEIDILSGMSPEKEELSKEDMVNGVVEGLINKEMLAAVHILHQNR